MLSTSGEGQESSPQPPSYPRSESQATSLYLPGTVSCPWGGRTEKQGRVPVFPREGLGAAAHPVLHRPGCPGPGSPSLGGGRKALPFPGPVGSWNEEAKMSMETKVAPVPWDTVDPLEKVLLFSSLPGAQESEALPFSFQD